MVSMYLKLFMTCFFLTSLQEQFYTLKSTRKRDCKFPKHALQNMFLQFANSDFGICKIRKLTFANTWPPLLQNSKTVGWQFWFRVSSKSRKIKTRGLSCCWPHWVRQQVKKLLVWWDYIMKYLWHQDNVIHLLHRKW